MIIEENKFPCWMYSATQEARIFNSEAELELAEGEWHDSPAAIPMAPEKADKQ